jgi:protein-disulfide isomerase
MSDFQCPFCKRHSEQTFPAPGKRIRHHREGPLDLHQHAADLAASQRRRGGGIRDVRRPEGKFWPAHDLLYRRQEVWAPLKNPAAFLISLTDSLKLPKAKVSACLQNAETREEIRKDAEGAAKAGAQSTPAFYIEGGIMAGAWPPEVWRPILDSVYKMKTKKP